MIQNANCMIHTAYVCQIILSVMFDIYYMMDSVWNIIHDACNIHISDYFSNFSNNQSRNAWLHHLVINWTKWRVSSQNSRLQISSSASFPPYLQVCWHSSYNTTYPLKRSIKQFQNTLKLKKTNEINKLNNKIISPHTVLTSFTSIWLVKWLAWRS